MIIKKIESVLLQGNINYKNAYVSNFKDFSYVNLWYDTYSGGVSASLHFEHLKFTYITRYTLLNYRRALLTENIADSRSVVRRFNEDVKRKQNWQFVESIIRLQYQIKWVDFFADVTALKTKNRATLEQSYFEKESYNLGVIIDLNYLFFKDK